MASFLADEHVPGPFIAVLRSLGHDVVRAKDELEEGVGDQRLLEYAHHAARTVVTSDRRFTVVDGAVVEDHAGVIYADQATLQARPEDAAFGVDRIVTNVPGGTLGGREFYLRSWM